MWFSSILFIFYFLPTVLILYYIFKFSTSLKNTVLLIASLIFYGWGHIGFLIILLTSIFANFIFALFADAFRKKKVVANIIIFLMCTFNIGVLFVYKYLGFMTIAINDLFHTSLTFTDLSLPIGISFFTLKAISYVVDVYRQKAPVQKNIFNAALYMSFFPQVLAGPVVQYSDFQQQLALRSETIRMFSVGCCRFITGLAKKIIIANQLAVVVDNIFAMNAHSQISASLAWLGAIAFSLQIYYDLSGYSDIAIGLCLMFGFKIEENINYPYISKSITEFWRRWHISLVRWFDEYIYTPLGGSKLNNKDKVIRNLFFMWILIGIWHGAGFPFLIWGLLNFVFILLEKLLSIEKADNYKTLRVFYMLFVTNILWVVFRADSLNDAGNYIASMFGFSSLHSNYTFMFIQEYLLFFILGLVFVTPVAKRMNRRLVDKVPFSTIVSTVYPLYIVTLFIICVAYITKGTTYPFIFGG